MTNTRRALARRAIIPNDDDVDLKVIEERDIGRNTPMYRNEHGLTERQEGFARMVANGTKLSEAYKANYDCSKSKDATVYSQASRMLDNPNVKTRIETLSRIRRERTHALDAMLTRQHVFERLMHESMLDESPPAARIRALELLGKIDVVSMFSEQKGIPKKEEADPKELEDKLKLMLQGLFGLRPGTISSGENDEPREAGEE